MNKSKVVLRFLLPTYQDTPEAIHPTVCSLRHPATRFEANLMLDRLSFFAARTNMGGIGKFLDQSSYLTRIISLIQTHPLRLLLCWLWASYRDTLKRRLDHFAVMSIRPGNRHTPTGIPLASVNRLRLTPFWARSVGFGPVFSPAQRSLCHGPIHRLPRPINPLQLVIVFQRQGPEFHKNSGLRPFLKSRMGCATRTNTRLVQSVPLAAGSQYKEDAVHGLAVRYSRPTPAETMRIGMLGYQRLDFLP